MEIQDFPAPYKLVKGRHGWFLANPHDVYVGRALITYGEYGELEWQLVRQLLRPGMDAVEVGANIGGLTVPMARALAATGSRLLAVEPQLTIFQNLCANLALNGLTNVRTENCACGDVPGFVTFAAPDIHREGNFGGIVMRQDGLGDQRMRLVTLDELLPPGFQPGLIKLDVEGFEQKVLEGARQTIAAHRPLLYLENDQVDKSKALIEWLWAAKYRLFWHAPELFNPANFTGQAENLYPQVSSFNMLALPEEMKQEMQGFILITDSSVHPLRRG